MTCIYKITSPTDKVYIGQTIDFKRRTREYSGSGCKNQKKLYNSLKKHGWSAHKSEILLELREDTQPEMLTYWEQFFMDYYLSRGYDLLNLVKAGRNLGHSDKTKTRLKNLHLGKKRSAESRKKMSEAQLGKKLSEETRRKMSLSRSGINHPLFGKPRSSETKQKISSSSCGEKAHNFKGFVLAYKDDEFVGRYAGFRAAAKQLGVPSTSVWRSLAQQRSLKSGYRFVREPLTMQPVL